MTDVNAEARRIKKRIEACRSVEEVHAVAAEERAAHLALAKMDGGKGLAHQIANLKAYHLNKLTGVYR